MLNCRGRRPVSYTHLDVYKRQHYAFQQPYILLPDLQSSDITDPLIEENYYAILPIAQGLTVKDTAGRVTELLTTSDTAFSKKAGYNLETYEKEDGDTDGPFALAVSIEADNDGQIVWSVSYTHLNSFLPVYRHAIIGEENVCKRMEGTMDGADFTFGYYGFYK